MVKRWLWVTAMVTAAAWAFMHGYDALYMGVTVFLLHVMTLIVHDVGHHAVFAGPARNRLACRLYGIVFFGFDPYPVCRDHFLHHAFPNVLGADTALETAWFIWHESQQVGTSMPLSHLQKRPGVPLSGAF